MNLTGLVLRRRVAQWLKSQRQSTRLSFILQLLSRILMSVCALAWTPLLLGAMGRSLNGIFLNLQSLASLGGLGDLGVGGTVSIQTSRHLGQGRVGELLKFLAVVRGFFLVLTAFALVATLILAPHLFAIAKFNQVAGVGSLSLCAAVLAAAAVLVMLNSYAVSLNYGCGNVLWPIVPVFLLVQAATLGLFLLARQHFPLWAMYLPFLASSVLTLLMSFYFVRTSHPELATILPIRLDAARIGRLLGQSFWVYLYSAAAGIYILTDQFMVSHGFGPGMVPLYIYNMKLADLAAFAINSACLVSIPKITSWFASSEAASQDRARYATENLSRLQIILGCAAALVYLTTNDALVHLWLGRDYRAPFALEIAFAAVLVTTAAGQAGFDMTSRCSEGGLRVGGASTLSAAMINFGLSWGAMRLGCLWGIASATAVAQVFVMLTTGRYTARHMRLSWWRLTVRNMIIGFITVGLGAYEHQALQEAGALKIILVLGINAAFILAVARFVGIRAGDIRREMDIFKAMIGL